MEELKIGLHERMKGYEKNAGLKLSKEDAVIIRLDGKAFHTFTRGLQKPFDFFITETMQQTMLYLCEEIQGCVLGYTQSDEITLVLLANATPETSFWYDGKVQKICSVAASLCTLYFNKFLENLICTYYDSGVPKEYTNIINKGALFDARCFNVPIEDVTNCVYWRQADGIRNSIQAMGQSLFTQKELHRKSTKEIKEMIATKGAEWGDLTLGLQRGVCAIRVEQLCETCVRRKKWVLDKEIPLFRGETRNYIEDMLSL